MKENLYTFLGKGIVDALLWATLVGIAFFLAELLDSISV